MHTSNAHTRNKTHTHTHTTAQTTVVKKENGWSLLVDGKPFKVKGVTFGYDKDVKKYDTYCKDLQFLGVNTIRI